MKRLLTAAALLLPAAATVSRADLAHPTLVESYYLGNYYLQVGQKEKAIETYRAVIDGSPGSAQCQRAWLIVGDAYLALHLEREKASGGDDTGSRSGFFDKADEAYRAAAAYPAVAAEARIRLGKLYAFHAPGEEAAGRSWFREVIDHYPEKAGEAAVLMGRSFSEAGIWEPAVAAWQEAVVKLPETAALAKLLQARGMSALEDPASAIGIYSEIVASFGIDGFFDDQCGFKGTTVDQALEGLIDDALSEEDPGFAAEVTGNVIRAHPATNVAMQARLRRAELLHKQGKTAEAVESLDGIALNWPASEWAVRALFREAEMLGGSVAVPVYERIRRNWPRSRHWVRASLALAAAAFKAGETENEAVNRDRYRAQGAGALREIVSRYPGTPEAAEAAEVLNRNGFQP
ncbi:MAG TPA: tetratricopeptide repeat protein [bacterium]|nr:tetratricopeptide repeat protein [bacterium]HPJ71809.1 tetratricopeptide repeat protein [bacterium]HPQ65292.1 tetratricopeptide repeat protein [bacterium]